MHQRICARVPFFLVTSYCCYNKLIIVVVVFDAIDFQFVQVLRDTHKAEAENIRMSMFNFERDEDRNQGTGHRGRGRGRGRGSGRGRGKGRFG